MEHQMYTSEPSEGMSGLSANILGSDERLSMSDANMQ